ncbi:MAG: ADP-ribosylglycohydrolase family protein, partial [bacterium]|nr:ADP-ribosylglycohydrolase family protein [bacterium]
ETEAIYQFLVRRGKSIPFLSRGEEWPLAFDGRIDYTDRYRGVVLGQAIGASMGRITQGLTPGDIKGLYGGIELFPDGASGSTQATRRPSFNGPLLAQFARDSRIDPEAIAIAAAADIARQDATEGESRFAVNLGEQRFPWFEAGEPVAESAAACRCIPVALLNAGDYRRLKMETGICATITHPNAASLAGAILLSISIARLLHAMPGSLDPIHFARSLAPFIAGIESERGGSRGRGIPSLARRVGTELPALLLRRASSQEILKSVGNGESPSEGIPFALACLLSSPDGFRETLLSAIESGNDAVRIGAMTGALSGALLGASSIPPDWKARVEDRESLEAAADALLQAARLSVRK